MKTKSEKTASQTFNENLKQANELLTQIRQQVREFAKKQKQEPKDWGYAGSMGHVVEELTEINAFLGR